MNENDGLTDAHRYRNHCWDKDSGLANNSSTGQTNESLFNPLSNAALHYGSNLVGSGKKMVSERISQFLSLYNLQIYFSVNKSYLLNKLTVILIPFVNSNWSVKYDEGRRLLPSEDKMSPDLYIPLMAFMTYIFISSFVLGVKGYFSPDLIGNITSQGLAWIIIEVTLQMVILYFIGTTESLTLLDLIAYSAYKFINVNFCIIMRELFSVTGYALGVLYFGNMSAYFVMKSLKWRLMLEDTWGSYSNNVIGASTVYRKSKYFLFLTGLSHLFECWWLSSLKHLQT